MSLLEIEDLRKSFGALVVSDGIRLTVEPGECHAVIGPNGAGKTTLIGQITGELAPQSGCIRFDGTDMTRMPAHKRPALGLARSFQITEILSAMSVRDNVLTAAQVRFGTRWSFFGRRNHDAALSTAVDEALGAVRLRDRGDDPAASLAHGEKRGLELAMALVQSPKLLLLDEPMAGTGQEETARMIDLLGGLKERYAMLLVEHDMDAVFALADRVSVLVSGRIIATGKPADIRSNADVQRAYLGEDAA